MHIESLVVSAVLSACSMPAILGMARRNKLYDSTEARKIHTGLVPRLGGVGIFYAFLVALLFAGKKLSLVDESYFLPLLGAVVVHLAGLYDDLKGMPARFKLAAQITAALLVVAGGFKFNSLYFSPDLLSGPLAWLSYIVTLGWIVGVTNAINLIDGLDGLAGGISCIAALCYAICYEMAGQWFPSFVSFAVAGAAAGFLVFNYPAPKAKLFMGDSGSLFLGFSLSLLPLLKNPGTAGAMEIGVLPAALILAIPIFDTLRAIYRRLKARISITSPDRLHFHHLLFDAGFTTKAILRIVYSITLGLALLFIAASRLPLGFGIPLLCLGFASVGILFKFALSLRSSHPRSKGTNVRR